MKRFIITIALACAVISAGAQITFKDSAPTPKTVKVGSVRAGLIDLCYDDSFYIIANTNHRGEIFMMFLGADRIRARWTMMDMEKLFDMEDGQGRTFEVYYTGYHARKVGKDRLHIRCRSDRGYITLTRKDCERLTEMIASFRYPDK